MSRYDGLDKLDLDGLSLVETYMGCKIYKDSDGRFSVAKRGFEIDSSLNDLQGAQMMADWFVSD
jgi:hypothetical protein